MAPTRKKELQKLTDSWQIKDIERYLDDFNRHEHQRLNPGHEVSFDTFHAIDPQAKFAKLPEAEHNEVINRYNEHYRNLRRNFFSPGWSDFLSTFTREEADYLTDEIRHFELNPDQFDADDFDTPKKKGTSPQKKQLFSPEEPETQEQSPIAGPSHQESPKLPANFLDSLSPRAQIESPNPRPDTPSFQEDSAYETFNMDKTAAIQSPLAPPPQQAAAGVGAGGSASNADSTRGKTRYTAFGKFVDKSQVKWHYSWQGKVKTFPYAYKQMPLSAIAVAGIGDRVQTWLKNMSKPVDYNAPGGKFDSVDITTTHLANFPTNNLGVFMPRVFYDDLEHYSYIDDCLITVKPHLKRTPFSTNAASPGTANSQMDCYGSWYIGHGLTRPSLEFSYTHSDAEPCVPTGLSTQAFPAKPTKGWKEFVWGWRNATDSNKDDFGVIMGVPRHLPFYTCLFTMGKGNLTGKEQLAAGFTENEPIMWHSQVNEFDFDSEKSGTDPLINYHHKFKHGLIKWRRPNMERFRPINGWGEKGQYIHQVQGATTLRYFYDNEKEGDAQEPYKTGDVTSTFINHRQHLEDTLYGGSLSDYEHMVTLPVEKCGLIQALDNPFDNNDMPPKLCFGVRPIQSNVSNTSDVKFTAVDVEWMVKVTVRGHSYRHVKGINYEEPHNMIKVSLTGNIITLRIFNNYAVQTFNDTWVRIGGKSANMNCEPILTDLPMQYKRMENHDYDITVGTGVAVPKLYAPKRKAVEEIVMEEEEFESE